MTREEAIEVLKKKVEYLESDKRFKAAVKTLIPELAESEEEKIRKALIEVFKKKLERGFEWVEYGIPNRSVLDWLEKQKECVSNNFDDVWNEEDCEEVIAEGQKLTPRFKELLKEVCHAWYDKGAKLEKQKDVSKAIEAVERIDKYIDENLANAHDMKDSNPDKKYYRGWDDALGEMARILQDVYSGEKQKETLRDFIDDFPYSDEQKEQKSELKFLDWVHGNWDDEYMINTVIGRYSLHAEVARKRGDTHDYNLSKSMESWLRSVVKPLIVEKHKKQKSSIFPTGFGEVRWNPISSVQPKPIKMEVYEVGKGTTICGQDYKCKKDYVTGTCRYIKDAIYHCSRDGYLNDQNGVSWSCSPEWFNEYIQSNTEWAEEEKTRFVSGQFLQCKLSFDGFKEGEHYWLEYIGDDMYVGRSDNILNQKFHITPRQLYTLFSQQLDAAQEPPQEEKQVSLNYEQPFDENPSDDQIIGALIHHLNEQDGFLTAINCVSTKAILSWLRKQKSAELSDDELQRYQKELHNFKVFAAKQAKEHHIFFVHDFEWNNFCGEILSYFNEQKSVDYEAELKKCKDNPLYFYDKYVSIKQKPAECIKATINGEPISTENHSVDISSQEWSGEDNICWDEAFACVTRAKKTAKNEEELQSAVTAEKWLKEIQFKYYVHPVKPEWSEEDETYLQDALWCIEKAEEVAKDENDMGNCWCARRWLKSLPLKPKKENEEWRHYIWATNLRFDFTALIKYDNTDNYEIVQAGHRPKQEKNGVYILIKDIKPQSHWKPSEHQMNILKAVKDYVGKGSGYWGEGLGSLIDDLEKLI